MEETIDIKSPRKIYNVANFQRKNEQTFVSDLKNNVSSRFTLQYCASLMCISDPRKIQVQTLLRIFTWET